ncbi:HNH endonuclease [Paractinoplanes deccanensis]|uniref:HNH endonuclease n=1 Tax=Paractinoplanes deccanensis TaxID=113561 RepID=A0ABQ3Y9N9_9ACTN|nr:HNH endonuclease signature motif containing protein [Actinoplanes deccanensis]GID76717.1 HNH endonuclease [Actinoplanes deccanensis]
MLADVRELNEDAAKLAASSTWPLSDDDLTACLRATHHLAQTVAVMQARLVREAESRGLPTAHGHRTTAGWLRSQLRLDPHPARELSARAATLDRHAALQEALLDGHADIRQATEIADALDNLTTGLAELGDLGPATAEDILRNAETTMIDMAARLSAHQLRRIGERILAHVAPHLAERADELALARQEARAQRARGFTLSAPAEGLVRLTGRLGAEDAAIVQAALQPLCAPHPGDDRSPAQRRADALTEVCRLALRTGELPDTGGEPAQLAVTVGYDQLTQSLGTATTDTGSRLSATAARRMACDARLLPVVLGSAGQVLDVGRTRRLATGPLRRALHLRDGGCAFPDCDRPPRWTDAHHIIAWTAGGTTSLDNLVLLCRHHHRIVHDPAAGWQIRLGADRQPEFLPPPHVDRDRRPRRNLYHLRL